MPNSPANEPWVLQPKTGVKVLCTIVYLLGVSTLSIRTPFHLPDRFHLLIVLCYTIFGALWLTDIFLRRIVLHSDAIRILSLSDFQSRTIPRSEIESVTWEKGAGASLKLRDGKWIRLPNVGLNPQGLANTIRAWL